VNTIIASVVALHVGKPESLGFDGAAAWFDQPWTTAIFKRRVDAPTAVRREGLVGDRQADRENHGGPDKAICVYPAAHYALWRDDLREALNGEAFDAGAFGENVTVQGLTESGVCIGDVYGIGRDVVVQVSQPRQPCWKLARKWRIKDLTARAIEMGRTGWYFRVLGEGTLQIGDALTLRERPHPEWTINAANRVMHFREGNTRALADLDELSQSWKHTLRGRS
jgi:MOSC domain-containing protein YiiM